MAQRPPWPGLLAVLLLALAVILVVVSHLDRRSERTGVLKAVLSQRAVIGTRRAGPTDGEAPVRAAASRFVTAYLTHVYGTGRPQSVSAASPALREQLGRNTARLPPAQRGRHARVVALRVTAIATNRAQVTARIDDGRIAAWPLPLSLRRTATGAWEVTSLGD